MAKSLNVVTGIVSVCCVAPLWYYLLYWLLKHTGAGELQWFLYWLYLPLAFLVAILKVVLDRGEH
jgi:hypothetical protein